MTGAKSWEWVKRVFSSNQRETLRTLVLGIGRNGWMINDDIKHLHSHPYTHFYPGDDMEYKSSLVEKRFRSFARILDSYDRVIVTTGLSQQPSPVVIDLLADMAESNPTLYDKLIIIGFEPFAFEPAMAQHTAKITLERLGLFKKYLFSYANFEDQFGQQPISEAYQHIHLQAFESAREAFEG